MHPINLQSFIWIELDPAKLEEVEELVQVLVKYHVHATFIFVVEAEHQLVRAWMHAFDDVIQEFDVKRLYYSEFNTPIND